MFFLKDMIDFMKFRPEKIQAWLKEIRTYNFCDTGTALYQLSYQTLSYQLGAGHVVNS